MEEEGEKGHKVPVNWYFESATSLTFKNNVTDWRIVVLRMLKSIALLSMPEVEF